MLMSMFGGWVELSWVSLTQRGARTRQFPRLTSIHRPRSASGALLRFGSVRPVCVLISTVSGTDESRRSADREGTCYTRIHLNHPQPPPSLLCEPVAGEIDEQERVLVQAQPVDVERPRASCCGCARALVTQPVVATHDRPVPSPQL